MTARRVLSLPERARRAAASAVYYALLERLRVNPIARCLRVVELHMEWERRK
jgi:hypothetical protein